MSLHLILSPSFKPHDYATDISSEEAYFRKDMLIAPKSFSNGYFLKIYSGVSIFTQYSPLLPLHHG